MRQKIIHIILMTLCASGLFSACADEVSLPHPDNGEAGNVLISYALAGNETSRAEETTPEPGWDNPWNENLITRLDVFIFRRQQRTAYYSVSGMNEVAPQTGNEETDKKELEISLASLFPDDGDIQAGDVVYLIANHPSPESLSSIKTLFDLQKAEVTGLRGYEKQSSFVMDGKMEVTGDMINGKDITIGIIPLRRASVKIRLLFSGDSRVKDWTNVKYRFYHYATKSTVLALDTEGENAYLNDLELAVYPVIQANEGNEFNYMKSVDDDTENLYGDEVGDKQLVLYSYANNWHDGDTSDDRPYQEAPIDENKETYILLYAPYTEDGKTVYGYYKIPVNYRLPENNDDENIKPEDYLYLYRLQRNYIYDITVKIDRAGGTESEQVVLPSLQYHVAKWVSYEIEVPEFD